jgi:5-methylcytosine-specific restriction protein A
VARLKAMAPRLAGLKPRLARLADPKAEYERARRLVPWRGWYKLAEWRRLRWDTLVRDRFTCGMCGRVEADTSKLVADHKVPHRGDRARFFDPANLWTLCASPCHASLKQREEQGM